MRRVAIGLLLMMCAGVAASAQKGADGLTPDQREYQGLDEEVQGLKEDVLKINHELMLLEEKLVYPSSTQVSVFVSIEPYDKFSLDSIELRIDDKVVDRHIYTYREMQALQKGGVQRLHTGNLPSGTHKIGVTVAGQTGGNKAYKHTAGFSINKAPGPKLVELKVVKTASSQPVVVLNDWK